MGIAVSRLKSITPTTVDIGQQIAAASRNLDDISVSVSSTVDRSNAKGWVSEASMPGQLV